MQRFARILRIKKDLVDNYTELSQEFEEIGVSGSVSAFKQPQILIKEFNQDFLVNIKYFPTIAIVSLLELIT
jgi:hypothetical protein